MSANQIPAPRLSRVDLPGQRTHTCTRCWMNGGTGHNYATRIRLATNPDATEVGPVTTISQPCTYWSASQHEYCGSRDDVRVDPLMGARCHLHNPDVLKLSRALKEFAAQAAA